MPVLGRHPVEGDVALVELRELDGRQVAVVSLVKADAWQESEHPRDRRGRFARRPGGGGPAGLTLWERLRHKVGRPINVGGDVDRAAKLLGEGKAVRLDQPSTASTLLDRLAQMAHEAEAKGDKAPNYDLCKVSVKKTNLFCSESKGIPRVKMPQLKGVPLPGSKADKFSRDERGEVDLGPEFLKYLEGHGIKTLKGEIPAANLRATQRELNGGKVAGIMGAVRGGKKLEGEIWVSRDNYIVDGHHRWAADVGIDSEDNELGDISIPVKKADAPIPVVLAYAKQFSREYGLPQMGVADKPSTPKVQLPDRAPKAKLEVPVEDALSRAERRAGLPVGQGTVWERLQVYISWLHQEREEYFGSTYEEPAGNLALLKRLAELNGSGKDEVVAPPKRLARILDWFGDHEASLFDSASELTHLIGLPGLGHSLGNGQQAVVLLRHIGGHPVAVVGLKKFDPNQPRDRYGRWTETPDWEPDVGDIRGPDDPFGMAQRLTRFEAYRLPPGGEAGPPFSSQEAEQMYREGWSGPTNHLLRGIDPVEQPWLAFTETSAEDIRTVKRLVPGLDAAVANGGKTPRDVYRGVNLLTAPHLADGLHKGASFTDAGFLSTSGNEMVADNFTGRTREQGGDPIVLHIKVPAGTRSMQPPDIGEHEAEFVLPRGGTFLVTSDPYVENFGGVDVPVIDAEWSPPRAA